MSKYRSKKGTVINIPEGLNPKQVAKIKADADAGYGTRAQETARQLGKKAKKNAATNVPVEAPPTIPGAGGNTEYFNDKGEIADPNKVISDLTPTPDMNALLGDIEKARSGFYNYATRDFAANKARELEDQKQEFANRGIPYDPAAAQDPNSQNLYGRTIGGITRRYDDMYAQASDRAYSAALDQGTQAYNAAVGAAGQSNDSFLKAILGMSDQQLAQYGIDKDYAAKLKAIAASKQKSGGTPAPSGGGDSGGGFEILA